MDLELKKKLDDYVERYNTKDFIPHDPVQFLYRYTDKRDVEITALFVATIAWGNRTMILNSCNRLLTEIMNDKPFDFIIGKKWETIDESRNIHRTFFGRDLIYISRGLYNYYQQHESLEELFCGDDDVWNSIKSLRTYLAQSNDNVYSRHVSDPDKSACKRLHLMLKWLVRQDGIVDLGVWKKVDPAKLMMPLDVHVSRVGRELGLTQRKGNDRKTVEEITMRLKELCPEDPTKYDFAIFGFGVNNKNSTEQ